MKKALVTVGFAVATVMVSALCFAAWRPVVPVPQEAVPAPVVQEDRPFVLETSAVLVLTPQAKEAPKARPVARKAKRVDCSNAKHRDVEQTALGTSVVYCHD